MYPSKLWRIILGLALLGVVVGLIGAALVLTGGK